MSEEHKERRSTVSTPGPATRLLSASADDSGRAIDDLIKMNMLKLQNMTLREAADEFLKSEQIYVERGLRVAVETFQMRIVHTRTMGEDIITEQESQQIFFSIGEIYALNRRMCAALVDLRMDGFEKFIEDLGQTVSLFIPFLKMYSQYIHNFRKAQETLTSLAASNFRFQKFLVLNELCSGSKLLSLLRTPIARLPQYLAYLGNIQSKMEFENPALKQAISELKSVADAIAKRCKDDTLRQSVVELQTRVFSDTVDIVAPHRKLVKKGVIDVVTPDSQVFMFKSKRKEYQIWLFNDMLLLGHNPSLLVRGYISKIARLEGMVIEDLTGKKAEGDIHIRCDMDSVDLVLACKEPGEAAKWIKVLTKFAEKASSLTLGDTMPNSEDFKNVILKKPLKGGRVRRPSTLRRATISSPEPVAPSSSDGTVHFHRSTSSLPLVPSFPPDLPRGPPPISTPPPSLPSAPSRKVVQNEEIKWAPGMQCLAPWSDNNLYLATIDSIASDDPDAVVYLTFTEYQEASVAVLSQLQRAPEPEIFVVGEHCLAPWSDGQYYPAVVDSLDGEIPFANITFTQYQTTACIFVSKLRKVTDAQDLIPDPSVPTSGPSDTPEAPDAPPVFGLIGEDSTGVPAAPPAPRTQPAIPEKRPRVVAPPQAPAFDLSSLTPLSSLPPAPPLDTSSLPPAPPFDISSVPAPADRDSLLSNIRQGQTLRHVVKPEKQPEPRSDNGQMGLLMKSLERYRKAVELDQPEAADDDSDFD